jgi:hypothetical protein
MISVQNAIPVWAVQRFGWGDLIPNPPSQDNTEVFKHITENIQTHDSTSLAIQTLHDHCDHLLGKQSETIASFEKIMNSQETTFFFFTFMEPCIVNVFMHNQQDATLRNGIYYHKCSIRFRRFLRPSSGARNCIHSIWYLLSPAYFIVPDCCVFFWCFYIGMFLLPVWH